MKIAIIGAMQKEIDFILGYLEEKKEIEKLNHTFYQGRYNNHNLVVVKAGIGKVASGLLFSALFNSFPDLDLVINIGISGGVAKQTQAGTIVIAKKLAYADVDATIDLDYRYGQVPGWPEYYDADASLIKKITSNLSLPFQIGTILTGDQFYTSSLQVEEIIRKYFPKDDVLAFDMESAALAQGAWFYKIPYLAVRVISDVIGNDSQYDEYEKNSLEACQKSNLALLEILNII
jgi:adenosylhomocysteine nucleosidase